MSHIADWIALPAAVALNGMLFKPLPRPAYNFSFSHPRRHLVFIPIRTASPVGTSTSVSTSSRSSDEATPCLNAAAAPATSATTSNHAAANSRLYHVPCMWIPARSADGPSSVLEATNLESTPIPSAVVTPPAAAAASSVAASSSPPQLRERRMVLIHFHGTSGDIEKSHLYAQLHDRFPDVDVLSLEFPGYGCASPIDEEGRPFHASRRSTVAVGLGVVRYLIERRGVPISRILLSGRSMGSGVALEVAARVPMVAGVMLISPYTNIADILRPMKPPFGRWIARLFEAVGCIRHQLFDSLAVAASLRTHLWIAHGRKDRLIPLWQGELLARRATPGAASVTLIVTTMEITPSCSTKRNLSPSFISARRRSHATTTKQK